MVKLKYQNLGGDEMGVYDMVVANVECPYCGKEVRWLEQINKGSYQMRTIGIGDLLPKECSFYDSIWKYDNNCRECKKHYKINFYFEGRKFTKAVVFDSNWIKKETYYKIGKKSASKSLDELQQNLIHLKNDLNRLKSERKEVDCKIENIELEILKTENEVKKRFQLKT
jgi:hypothetical protein